MTRKPDGSTKNASNEQSAELAVRDAQGRFVKGNPGGGGYPYARAVGRLRQALIESVTEEDIQAIVRSLVAAALQGDVAAAREVLQRCLGPAVAADLLERLERIEAVAEQLARDGRISDNWRSQGKGA